MPTEHAKQVETPNQSDKDQDALRSKQRQRRRSSQGENGRASASDIKRKQRRSSQEHRVAREVRKIDKQRQLKSLRKRKETKADVTMQQDSSDQISDLLERLHNPTTAKLVELTKTIPHSIEHHLTKIPWSSQVVNKKDNGTDQSKSLTGSQNSTVSKDANSSPSNFLNLSYLDLRIQQNTQWATRRLRDGVRLAKESKWRAAEDCYKEGLSLVPDHAELQVAYGALYASTGRRCEAISILEKVIRESPGVANAQQYLDAIRNPNGVTPKAPPIRSTAAETALRDAMTERAFLAETLKEKDPKEAHVTDNKKYAELSIEELSRSSRDSVSSSEHRRRRTKRHKHRRKSYERGRSRKRKHRRRHRSPSLSGSSIEDSRRRRSRRRRHRSPSYASSPSSGAAHRDRVRPSVEPSSQIDNASHEANGVGRKSVKEEKNESTRKRNDSRSSSISSHRRRRRRRKHRSASHSDSHASGRRRRSKQRRKHRRKKHSSKRRKKSSRGRRRSQSASDISSRSRKRHDSPPEKAPSAYSNEKPESGMQTSPHAE